MAADKRRLTPIENRAREEFAAKGSWRKKFGHAVRGLVLTIMVLGCPWAARGQAVYVPNSRTNNLSGYVMNPETGALARVPGSPFATGTSPVQALVHPNGRFLYVLNSGSGDISRYAIAAPSGSLIPTDCPRCAAPFPVAMAIDPSGQHLFVASASQATITPFTISQNTGDLTPQAASALQAGANPTHLAVDPSGRFLYVTYFGTGQVAGFAVGSGGHLTPVPGSPFAAGSGSHSVAVSSNRVFVANEFSADITVFAFDGAGSLTQLGPAVPAGGVPFSIAVNSTGSLVFVANQLQVLPFEVIPNGPYALTGSRAAIAQVSPSIVVVDPSGDYVYVADPVANDISGFAVGAFGTLTPLGTVSSFGESGPGLLTVHHIGDPTALALTSGYPSPASPAAFGAAVEFRGTVADLMNPGTAPTGSVSFFVDGVLPPNGTVPLNAGGFDFLFNGATRFPGVGQHVIHMVYNPGAGFEAPVPLDAAFTVNRAAPAFSLGYSPGTAVAGQSLTLSVSSVQTGGQYPSGSVVLLVDNVAAGAPISLTNGAGGVSFTLTGGDHTLSMSYTGDATFLAIPAAPVGFHVKYPTTTTLSISSPSPMYGETVTLRASISSGEAVSAASGGSGNPSGSIVFRDGSAMLGTVPVNNGSATFITSALRPGPHSITALYEGDAAFLPALSAVFQTTVASAMPGMAVTLAPASVVVGQPTTITATLAGGDSATGTVTFFDENGVLGAVAISGGRAAITYAPMTAGTHTLIAEYSGDANYAGASNRNSPLTVQWGRAATAVSAPTITGDATFGQTLTISATVSVTPPGSGKPTGTVTFWDGVSILATAAVMDGSAATTAPLVPGVHNIIAVYSGDANFAGSSSAPAGVSESKAASTTSLKVTTLPSTISMTATVHGTATLVPTGAVQFFNGQVLLGTVGLVAADSSSATATFTAAAFTGTVTAVYLGNAALLPSTSPEVAVDAIDKYLVLLAVASTPAVTGKPVVLTAALYWNGPLTPTGTVRFYDGDTLIGTVPAAKTVTLTVVLTAGYHAISAAYSGDTNYSSASANADVFVERNTLTDFSIRPGTVDAVTGQTVSLTARVSPPAGTDSIPGGQVQWSEAGVVFATSPLVNGVAVAVLSGLLPGVHSITASYTGDNLWNPAISSAAVVKVAKAMTSTTIWSDPAPPGIAGVTVVARVSVVVPGSGVPTGSVRFVDGPTNRVLVEALLDKEKGTASAVLPNANAIVAIYSGDDLFSSSSSSLAGNTAILNSASYLSSVLAPGEIATVFVAGLTTTTVSAQNPLPHNLGGLTVSLIDSAGLTYSTLLFYVSPSQITFLVPPSAALGAASLRIDSAAGTAYTAVVTIGQVAPGLFTANGDGKGVAAAQVVRVHADGTSEAPQAIATYDSVAKVWTPAAIDLGTSSDQVYLILYGTGIQNGASAVTASVQGQTIVPTYAGAQGETPGLDQINLLLPASLRGSGLVSLTVSALGQVSNVVTLRFQ